MPQTGLTRIKPHDYELKLDSGKLAGSEESLAKVIESYWSTGPYHLKVRWVKNDPAAFQFKLSPFQFFSHVSYREKRIYLDNYPTPGLVAHEVGHVLGFDDAYTFRWDPKDCRMNQAAQVRDLMANHNYHRALTGHWQVLERAYARNSKVRSQPMGYTGEEILFADQNP
jgi:hypothetical protein